VLSDQIFLAVSSTSCHRRFRLIKKHLRSARKKNKKNYQKELVLNVNGALNLTPAITNNKKYYSILKQ
jgi:hypothetical protein